MPAITTTRATVYLDSSLHRALKYKSVETRRSVSELVNDALRLSLAEDAADLAVFEERKTESTIPFEEFVADLKRRGRI